jgi:hypothetical protein
MKLPLTQAIRAVQTEIRWKPNSAARHLRKRKLMGHLPNEATMSDYESLILQVVNDDLAKVYLFWYGQVAYVTIVTTIQETLWLVMFGLDGLMETAFVIDIPNYLVESQYEEIGLLREVMAHGA